PSGGSPAAWPPGISLLRAWGLGSRAMGMTGGLAPAPFGRMIEVIPAGIASNDRLLTARSAPNDLLKAVTLIMARPPHVPRQDVARPVASIPSGHRGGTGRTRQKSRRARTGAARCSCRERTRER